MGTPCVIAMRNGEDLYHWIFSPYDGNIQSAGRMLFDHYDTREKVERLLDNGDIDLLAPTVEECEPLSERSPYYSGGQGSKDELPMFGELHTYIWRDRPDWRRCRVRPSTTPSTCPVRAGTSANTWTRKERRTT